MASCTTTALTKGIWKHKEDLDMKLNTDADISEVTFLYRPDGETGYKSGRLREGETWIINDYVNRGLSWELTFDDGYDYNTAIVTVCNTSEDAGEPEPEPDPEPSDGGGATIEEINTSLDNQSFLIAGEVRDAGSALSSDIADVVGQVAANGSLIGSLTGYIDTAISDLRIGLTNQIGGITDGLTGGFDGLREKIDGLEFPSLESIKQAFLDTCADLAVALWDAILDRIEERYPDDEEESD
jgi:hypothetical protein